MTAYNPNGDLTNAGNDWYFENRVADPPDADAWIGWVSGAKSKSLVTIPACVIMLGLRTQLNITL